MSDPAVSVVVSTFNRPTALERLLLSLAAQTLPRERFEVIVVDNGSGPETGEVLNRHQASGELPLRRVRHELTLGPGGGRNSGWREARAPLVAFTDDDCEPEPGWLAALVATAAQASTEGEAAAAVIVQGRTLPAASAIDPAGLLVHSQRIETLGPWFETCNIAYPRALLERLDGFDQSFGLRPAGEDTDLAWRALDSGARAVFAPDAVVRHAVEPVGIRGSLRIAARWGPVARVLAAHPAVRAGLFRRVFWNVWHYLWWRSLLLPLLPRPLRRLLFARHLRWLASRASGAGAGGIALVWAVPFLWLHDGVESLAVARGAWRARTLVL